MCRCSQVNVLAGQHIHSSCCLANPLQLWQVRMKVESFDLLKKPQGVERLFNLDRRRRAVGCSGRPQSAPVTRLAAGKACQLAAALPMRLSSLTLKIALPVAEMSSDRNANAAS
jgi:hypothetical protein